MLKINNYEPKLKKNWELETYDNANEAWENLYFGLNRFGHESAPRGLKIKETLNCDIRIRHPYDNLVFNTFRGLNPIYLAKEYFWYKSGDRSVAEASKLSKFWETIANPDGTVNSNYGAYIFVKEADGKSVWDKTVEILQKDPDSRQAIIQIPIMPARGSKDTPCTSSIQFFIREDRLYATVYMRSTDVILGFPIDIFQFTMWQNEMARILHVKLGNMRFISGSLHCYEKHWIENVDKSYGEFMNSVREDYEAISDKAGDGFQNDLVKLKLYTKGEEMPIFSDPLISYMFENRKVWK